MFFPLADTQTNAIHIYQSAVFKKNLNDLAPIIHQVPSNMIEGDVFLIAVQSGQEWDKEILSHLFKFETEKSREKIRESQYRVFRLAVEHGHSDMVQTLLEFMPPNERELMVKVNNGSNFHWSVKKSNLTILQQLLPYLSIPLDLKELRQIFSDTILFNHCDILKRLADEYSDILVDNHIQLVTLAAQEGSLNALLELVSRFPNVLLAENGINLAYVAAKNGHLDVLKYLAPKIAANIMVKICLIAAKNKQYGVLEWILPIFFQSLPKVYKFLPDTHIIKKCETTIICEFGLRNLLFQISLIYPSHHVIRALMLTLLQGKQVGNSQIEALIPKTSLCDYHEVDKSYDTTSFYDSIREICSQISTELSKLKLSEDEKSIERWFKLVPAIFEIQPAPAMEDETHYNEHFALHFRRYFMSQSHAKMTLKYKLALSIYTKSTNKSNLENLFELAPAVAQGYYFVEILSAYQCKDAVEYVCSQLPEEEKRNIAQVILNSLLLEDAMMALTYRMVGSSQLRNTLNTSDEQLNKVQNYVVTCLYKNSDPSYSYLAGKICYLRSQVNPKWSWDAPVEKDAKPKLIALLDALIHLPVSEAMSIEDLQRALNNPKSQLAKILTLLKNNDGHFLFHLSALNNTHPMLPPPRMPFFNPINAKKRCLNPIKEMEDSQIESNGYFKSKIPRMFEHSAAIINGNVLPAEGDGNCFFHAIADELRRTGKAYYKNLNHATVRTSGIQYLEHHRGTKTDNDLLTLEFSDDDTEQENYLKIMRADKCWATGAIILAVAKAYNIHLSVVEMRNHVNDYEDKDLYVYHYNEAATGDTVGLRCIDNLHFDAIDLSAQKLQLKC